MTIPIKASHSRIYDIFARWSTLSYRYAAWVLLAALLVTVVCGLYVSRNLGMNTDTTDMLSEHLPFRVNMKHYNETFPQDMETLLWCWTPPRPSRLTWQPHVLQRGLKKDTTIFMMSTHPTWMIFFERNGLLYESIPGTGTNHRSLGRSTAAHGTYRRKPHACHTFTSVLTRAVDELRKGRSMELQPVLSGISATLDARVEGSPRVLSWQSLFNGEPQKSKYQELIVVKPKLDYTQLSPAEQSIAALHAAAKDIGVTGNGAASAANYRGSSFSRRGAQQLAAWHGVCRHHYICNGGMVLYFAMRNAGLILNVLLLSDDGPASYRGFATAAVGHLNLISIAFAVLYIGLGADFAIHFLLRYREVLESGIPPAEAMHLSGGDAGRRTDCMYDHQRYRLLCIYAYRL